MVRAFDAESGELMFEQPAFEPGFSGGVNVAAADLSGDGFPDVVLAPASQGGPRVRVLDGKTGFPLPGLQSNFFAYDPSFTGGVQVAAADVDGDKTPDIVTAAGSGGGPHVSIFNGRTGAVLHSFFALDADFRGGLSVAAADFTGDGRAEVVIGAGNGGGPRVRVFDPTTGDVIAGPLGDFFASNPSARAGVVVGTDALAGDVNADGTPDLVTGSGVGEPSRVVIFSGRDGAVLADFSPFGTDMTAGVRVATAYVTDDPVADVVVGTGPGVEGRIRVFDGATGQLVDSPVAELTPFGSGYTGGVMVGASNDPPPGATLLQSKTTNLVSSSGQLVMVDSKVYLVDAAVDYFFWEYHVNNVNFDADGLEAGVGLFHLPFGYEDDGDTREVTSSNGWPGYVHTLLGSPGVYWQGDFGTEITPGNYADFSFVTDIRPIVTISAEAWTVNYSFAAQGTTLGPAKKPTVIFDSVQPFTLVNANNDNWKPPAEGAPDPNAGRWAAADKPGIPAKRDFTVTDKLWQNDPELDLIIVDVTHVTAGTLEVSVVNPAMGGSAKLWKNRNKDGGAFTSKQLPVAQEGVEKTDTVVLYIEGVHESLTRDDISITAKFTSGAVVAEAKSKKTTITPFILDFKAEVNVVQPTLLLTTDSSVVGMAAGKQATPGADRGSGGPGITIRGDLLTGGRSLEGKFVQVVTGVTNGNPSSFELVNGNKWNFQLQGGASFEISDSPAAGDVPYYPKTLIPDPIPNPDGRKTFYMVDSPGFAVDIGNSKLSRMDIQFFARTYLVWSYSDGSLYTIAKLNWQVVFLGSLQADGSFMIANTSKVSAEASVRTNEDPTKLVAPVYSERVGYVAV